MPLGGRTLAVGLLIAWPCAAVDHFVKLQQTLGSTSVVRHAFTLPRGGRSLLLSLTLLCCPL